MKRQGKSVVRILICDDHAVVRAGLRLILEQEEDFEIIGETSNAEESIKQVAQLHPDLMIMDISLPGTSGLSAISQVRELAPELKILVLTVHDDEAYFFRALQAGATGYMLKGISRDELLASMRLVLHGGVPIPRILGPRLVTDYLERVKNGTAIGYTYLSPREKDVLGLIAKGHTNKEIAVKLSLSVRTVERNRSSIMNKIGLQNRAELVAFAVRQGVLKEADF